MKHHSLPEPKLVRKIPQPMIMQLSPSLIIWAVNQQLERDGKDPIPCDATVSVDVPGGGDWSNTVLELDEGDIKLNIRWEA